jgi:SAM-dependent methyltransferase
MTMPDAEHQDHEGAALTDGAPDSAEWSDPAHVERWRRRAEDAFAAVDPDEALLEQLPVGVRRVLDLGCGDGRLPALLLSACPGLEMLVGLDSSELMLGAARDRFAAERRVEIASHDLRLALPDLGTFELVVSSLAIHHLEHGRKRSLYAEVFALLEPGGLFVNFEHVASPSRRLHVEFFAAIEEPLEHDDPSDRLLDVETQLQWLREIGFEDVDCHWKWRELALLAGVRRASA